MGGERDGRDGEWDGKGLRRIEVWEVRRGQFGPPTFKKLPPPMPSCHQPVLKAFTAPHPFINNQQTPE